MKHWSGTATTLAFLLLSACSGSPKDPEPLPTAPTISAFQADKTRITAGESVKLSFQVENATAVELVDRDGQKVEVTGDASSGEAAVSPTSTQFYVLRATGAGGKDVAYVQVAVNEDLEDVYLVAVPPRVHAGEPVNLLWSAPHARTASIDTDTSGQLTLDASSGGGAIEVTPSRTTTYILTASGADAQTTLTRAFKVAVDPVIALFRAAPAAALPGGEIEFSWQTGGASSVTLSEATFGELESWEASAQVDAGTFKWTLPATLPSGATALEGHPLKFTLAVHAVDPEVTVSREIKGYIGDGPRIDQFTAPRAVTAGKNITLSWNTTAASRLQVFARGVMIYEAPANSSEVDAGSLTLPAPSTDAEVELRAFSHLGAFVTEKRFVEVVQAPAVSTFNVSGPIPSSGLASTASWTTSNADQVAIRVKHGAELFRTAEASRLASGSTEIYPGLTTTLVIEAWNKAGDVATLEQRVVVTTPDPVSSTPAPTTPGQQVTTSWALPSTTGAVVGIPNPLPIRTPNSARAVVVEAHSRGEVVPLPDRNESIVRLAIPTGFRFPWFGDTKTEFWVSTNGFVAFENVGPLFENKDLTAQDNTSPTLIAPFWDDLDLSKGEIRYVVEGERFPRRLVIQWDKAQTLSDPNSELTFQVQLVETGEFRFIYEKLSGTQTAGEDATIGVQLQDGTWVGQFGFGQGMPQIAEADELQWFASGAQSGSFQFMADKTRFPTVFALSSTGNWVVYPSPVFVFDLTTLSVSEVMPIAPTGAVAGTWIELANNTSLDLDLGGLEITTASTATPYVIPAGTLLKRHGHIVFGESTVPTENGEAPNMEHAWTGITWADPNAGGYTGDSVEIHSGGQTIATLTWTDVPQAGQSIQPPEQALAASGGALTCTRTKGYGSAGAIGTPGMKNESCFGYSLSPTTYSWFDISTTGTELVRGQSDNVVIVDVSRAPIPFFGAPYSHIKVSEYGFVNFRAAVNVDTFANDTVPNASSPEGTVAPFGDIIDYDSDIPDSGVYIQRIEAGQDPANPGPHWIVQWNHLYWTTDDDINFQAKFFDDGGIEFHYGTLVNGGTTPYAFGDSATCWIESPDGTAALPVVKPQDPLLTPFTAFRFVPNESAR
ncbi:MAG: lamin tail domain-containing protein [Myxococcaceae bacterium]